MSDALSSLPPTGEGLHADPNATDADDVRQDRLDEVLAEYLLLADEGAVDQDSFLERYPEFADDLEAYFAAEEQVEQFNAVSNGPGDSERTHVFFANTPKGGHGDSADLNVLQPIDATATATVPRLIDDYEVLQEIAHGGMGRVFLARQTSLNRLVALKMTLSGQFASPHDVRRFRMEAEAAARLGDHPAIVPIYEVGEVDGRQYFTMQFIDGPSLAAKIVEGPIEPLEAARIVLQVAGAIQYAHEYGVLHRDLKPANILIDRNGQPKLTDFGLAKSADSSNALTSSGLIIGTPSYMSPEQASGKPGGWEPATDIYSLGAVLYACLVGKPPFQAAIVMETLRQVAEEEPVAPCEINPGVPKDLETICLKCLRKAPGQRYPTSALLADDLGRFLRHEPINARRVSKWERFRLWAKRRRAAAASIVAIVFMLIACTIISTSFALWALREAENATMQKNLVSLERDRADKGDLAAALIDLDRIIATRPPSGELYRWRGLCNEENGKLAEAIVDYAKASSLEPENPSNFERLAEVHLAQGDLPAAAADYRQAIERGPANGGYRTRLGIILERMSKPDEANQEYAEAIRRDPRQCNRAIARARVLLAAGQNASAFASVENLLKQGVEDSRLYLARADIVVQANQRESAADRDRAARLDPPLTSSRNPFGIAAAVPYSKDHEAVEFSAHALVAGGDEDRNAPLWPDPAFRAADNSIEGAWNCRFISPRGVVAEGAALIRSVGSSVFILQYDLLSDECRLFECNRTGDRLSGRYISLIHDDINGPWTARILGSDRIDGLTRIGRFDLRRQPAP